MVSVFVCQAGQPVSSPARSIRDRRKPDNRTQYALLTRQIARNLLHALSPRPGDAWHGLLINQMAELAGQVRDMLGIRLSETCETCQAQTWMVHMADRYANPFPAPDM